MELEARLADLAKVVKDHREVLLTEEAAKNALVMPFLQHLGYNVFNPSEVIPEFTCDVGTKKGEKVDYAISIDDSITMLVECKPANSELNPCVTALSLFQRDRCSYRCAHEWRNL